MFQPLLKLSPDQRRPLFSFIYQALAKSSPFSRPSHSNPTYPFLQSVCSALWGLCGGHLSHGAGDACRGRCVPPALLHLQCLFLPPADWRPLCPQGRTATVCQRGLPPVSGQPNLLRHRYKLFTVCLFVHVCVLLFQNVPFPCRFQCL